MEIDYSVWQEFGLAGVVIGSLFAGVYFIIRWIFGFVNSMADQHTSERAEWRTFAGKQLDEHREERKEWRDELKEINNTNKQGLDKVCDVLTQRIQEIAIKDLSNEE